MTIFHSFQNRVISRIFFFLPLFFLALIKWFSSSLTNSRVADISVVLCCWHFEELPQNRPFFTITGWESRKILVYYASKKTFADGEFPGWKLLYLKRSIPYRDTKTKI